MDHPIGPGQRQPVLGAHVGRGVQHTGRHRVRAVGSLAGAMGCFTLHLLDGAANCMVPYNL